MAAVSGIQEENIEEDTDIVADSHDGRLGIPSLEAKTIL